VFFDLVFDPLDFHTTLDIPKESTSASLIITTTAIRILLHKYSAYISDILSMRLQNDFDQADSGVVLCKTILAEQSFLSLYQETHQDLLQLTTQEQIFHEPQVIQLHWITDNEPDQKYTMTIAAIKPGYCKVNFHFSTQCFYETPLKNAGGHLQTLIENIINHPQKTVRDIEHVTNQRGLYHLLDDALAKPELLHSIFEQTVHQYPDNMAVIQGKKQLSYVELNHMANGLAEELIRQGVKAGDFVGILLKRSIEVYISMLAILKAGAAYVPIDVAYPLERIKYIINDCNVNVLITHPPQISSDEASCCAKIYFDEKLYDTLKNAKPTDFISKKIDPNSTAYVICTSGTTGTPKGILLPHQSVAHLIKAENKLFTPKENDRILQGFSVAFDASIEEIWLAFSSGATLIPATEELMHSAPDLMNFISEQKITILSTVPTLLSMLQPNLPSLRLLILGGEHCPHELLMPWHRADLRIVNTYGPTETAVIATYADFDPLKKMTIGKPLYNYAAFILDNYLHPVPTGVPGELCIAGLGLATGYLKKEALTHEKFITPSFAIEYDLPQRVYRTGDLVRMNEENNIEYLGRIDSQVKLRGYRLELEEIESLLLKLDNVKNAVATIKEDENKIQRLVAYIVLKDSKTTFNEKSCKELLGGRLASFMVPSFFILMDTFPQLPSGKVDKKQLPAPDKTHIKARESILLPRSSTEIKIHHIWQDFFAPQSVSIDDNFFIDLGGHSLFASLIISTMRKIPELATVSVQDIYTFPTIEKLSAHIDEVNAISAKEIPEQAKEIPYIRVSTLKYMSVASIQALVIMLFYALGSALLVTPFFIWDLFPNLTLAEIFLYLTPLALALVPVWIGFSILAKWILIGRFKPGRYPLWGWYYLRLWIVGKLISPMVLFNGTPFLNWYCRRMGAKIGKGVHLDTTAISAFDLLSIGDYSSISRSVDLSCYTVECDQFIMDHIRIGKNCFVGDRVVISENSTMEDNASLGELSLLPNGKKIPAYEYWAGSPAAYIGKTEASIEALEKHKALPFVLYLFLQLGAILFVSTLPMLFTIGLTLGFYHAYLHLGLISCLLAVIPVAALSTIGFCLLTALIKWMLLGKTKEEEFSIYSVRYIKQWIVDSFLHMVLAGSKSIYATIYTSTWLRLMGARIGATAEISTVNEISPDLLELGDKSFLADFVTIQSAEVRNGIKRLRKIKIGDRTFIGNSALLCGGAHIGNDNLIGVLSTPPKNNTPDRFHGTSWLGSPCMFLPKRQESQKFPDKYTFAPSLGLYCIRGLIEFFKITLPIAIPSALTILFYYLVYAHVVEYGILGTLLYAFLITIPMLLSLPLITYLFKIVLIGKYTPCNKPLWSVYVWKDEFINSLCESMVYPLFVSLFTGTPFIAWFFRLMGTKIGKRVYMATTEITEFDLVTVGDNVSLNQTCVLQTHLFEDRVMKMSYLKIEDNCIVGTLSVVLYDTLMEEGSYIDALSLVMKGESIPGKTKWAGSPAQFVKVL